tara:strand:+ start:842 stop:1129 length:288 start_codon:yes stop_codon:yes gene_type:complete
MAITKELINDKIEVVQKWNIQVRTATVIKEDGVELTRSFNRKVLVPGTLDASDNLVATNISGEDSDVQAICNAVWTTQVKADYKAFLIANKSATP